MKYVVIDASNNDKRHEFETEQQVIEFARTLPAGNDQPNKVIETFKQATNHIEYGVYGHKNLTYRIEYTVEERLAQLRKENEAKLAKEERCLLFQERLLKLLNITFLVVEHHDNNMHAFVERDGGYNRPDKFDRTKLREYYDTLLANGFVPECRPFKPSGKVIDNAAPACINFQNYFSELCLGHTPMAEVEFNFIGCSVSFKFPSYESFKGVQGHYKALPGQERNKHPKGKLLYSIPEYGSGLSRIDWYGSDYTMYAKDEQQATTLMNTIFGDNETQDTEVQTEQ